MCNLFSWYFKITITNPYEKSYIQNIEAVSFKALIERDACLSWIYKKGVCKNGSVPGE